MSSGESCGWRRTVAGGPLAVPPRLRVLKRTALDAQRAGTAGLVLLLVFFEFDPQCLTLVTAHALKAAFFILRMGTESVRVRFWRPVAGCAAAVGAVPVLARGCGARPAVARAGEAPCAMRVRVTRTKLVSAFPSG